MHSVNADVPTDFAGLDMDLRKQNPGSPDSKPISSHRPYELETSSIPRSNADSPCDQRHFHAPDQSQIKNENDDRRSGSETAPRLEEPLGTTPLVSTPRERDQSIADEGTARTNSEDQIESTGPEVSKQMRRGRFWTNGEYCVLQAETTAGKTWEQVAEKLPGRTAEDCQRFHGEIDAMRLPGEQAHPHWSPEEDKILCDLHNRGDEWEDIAKVLPARSVQGCLMRWKMKFEPRVPKKEKWWKEASRTLEANVQEPQQRRRSSVKISQRIKSDTFSKESKWTLEHDGLIFGYYNNRLTQEDLLRRLPGRTLDSIDARLKKLIPGFEKDRPQHIQQAHLGQQRNFVHQRAAAARRSSHEFTIPTQAGQNARYSERMRTDEPTDLTTSETYNTQPRPYINDMFKETPCPSNPYNLWNPGQYDESFHQGLSRSIGAYRQAYDPQPQQHHHRSPFDRVDDSKTIPSSAIPLYSPNNALNRPRLDHEVLRRFAPALQRTGEGRGHYENAEMGRMPTTIDREYSPPASNHYGNLRERPILRRVHPDEILRSSPKGWNDRCRGLYRSDSK